MPEPKEEIDVTGPAGVKFSWKGNQSFPVILLLLLSALFILIAYILDAHSATRNNAHSASIARLETASAKTDESLRTMIYILTLDQSERDRLNLMKPKQLSDMQR